MTLSSVSAKVRGASVAVKGRKHPVNVEDRIIPAVATKNLVFIVVKFMPACCAFTEFAPPCADAEALAQASKALADAVGEARLADKV